MSKPPFCLFPPTGRLSQNFHSDEGLTLVTSAFKIFHGGDSSFINSFDETKFSYLKLAEKKIWPSRILNAFLWDRFTVSAQTRGPFLESPVTFRVT